MELVVHTQDIEVMHTLQADLKRTIGLKGTVRTVIDGMYSLKVNSKRLSPSELAKALVDVSGHLTCDII